MPSERTAQKGSAVEIVQTDEWTISYDKNAQVVSIDPRPPHEHRHHHKFVGDPHDIMDGVQVFDFPAPTCSFVLTDGTLLVCDAPTAGSTIHDCHVFTDDGKHYALGEAPTFDENVGWVFVQQDDGSFYSTSPRPLTNHCVWNSQKGEWEGQNQPVTPKFQDQ